MPTWYSIYEISDEYRPGGDKDHPIPARELVAKTAVVGDIVLQMSDVPLVLKAVRIGKVVEKTIENEAMFVLTSIERPGVVGSRVVHRQAELSLHVGEAVQQDPIVLDHKSQVIKRAPQVVEPKQAVI